MPKLLVYVLLLGWAVSASAQPISLRSAVQTGLNNSPGYLAAKADSGAALAGARLAGSKKLPQLTFTEDLIWTNEPGNSLFIALNQQRLQLSPSAAAYNFPPDRSDFQSRLQLTQSLYDPDLRYGQQMAGEQAAAADAQQEAAAEALALRVVSAYLGVQRAEAVLSWVDASLAEAQELKRLSAERHQAGTGLKADLLNAEVRVADSLRAQLSARNQHLTAQRNLALQIGYAGNDLQIAEPLTLLSIPEPVLGDSSQRADLIALQRHHKVAQIGRRQATAAWQPRVNAGASWTLHDRDFPLADSSDSWMLNAGLTWVLFDGFGRDHVSAQARAKERSLLARYRQAVLQARFDQDSARLQGETLQQQLQVSQTALAATKESYQLLLARYQNGLTPLSEVLTVQTLLEKGRSAVTDSELQLLLNRAEQQYLQGNLLPMLLTTKGPKR